LVYKDIWGPCSHPSIHGHKYFLNVVNDFSRYTWTIHLESKEEVKTQV